MNVHLFLTGRSQSSTLGRDYYFDNITSSTSVIFPIIMRMCNYLPNLASLVVLGFLNHQIAFTLRIDRSDLTHLGIHKNLDDLTSR